MSKKSTSDRNHKSFEEEDTHEKMGTFPSASPEMLQKRVLKVPKRRLTASSISEGTGGAFANFHGMSKMPPSSTAFSFLKKSDNSGIPTNDCKVVANNAINAGVPVSQSEASQDKDEYKVDPPYTPSFVGTLERLNECFVNWINQHYSANKHVIFVPCFRDYERHLKDILPLNSSEEDSEKDKESSLEKTDDDDDVVNKSGPQGSKRMMLENDAPMIEGRAASVGTHFNSRFNATDAKLTLGDTISLFKVPQGEQVSNSFSKGSASLRLLSTVSSTGCPSTKEGPSSVLETQSGSGSGGGGDDDDVTPEVEFKPVVEDGSVYSRRCKVFVRKDGVYNDRGVGMLYIKPVNSGKNTQLIVRADTSLGNVLVNTLLSADMSMQKMGINNVLLLCIPTPDFVPAKPVPVLLRVKTCEDADELLSKLNEYKK